MTETWAIDELDRVMGYETVRYPHKGARGGEWDYLMGLTGRTKRKLLRAGLLTTKGMEPDVAADFIAARVPDIDGCDAAMAWYVRMALASVLQRRRVAHHRRHHRLAVRHGHPTYWYYRKTTVSAGNEEGTTP